MTIVPYLLLILCGVTLFTAVFGGPVVLIVGKQTLDAGPDAPKIVWLTNGLALELAMMLPWAV